MRPRCVDIFLGGFLGAYRGHRVYFDFLRPSQKVMVFLSFLLTERLISGLEVGVATRRGNGSLLRRELNDHSPSLIDFCGYRQQPFAASWCRIYFRYAGAGRLLFRRCTLFGQQRFGIKTEDLGHGGVPMVQTTPALVIIQTGTGWMSGYRASLEGSSGLVVGWLV